MTVCNRCGKENQDHYKFCLGCGAELVAAPTFRLDQKSFRARALAPLQQAAHELGRAVQAGGSIVAAR
jgi:hypothetical protein